MTTTTAPVSTGTIRTRIPTRLDRLPWSRFHWRVVIGLGTVWILDGLEVLLVGAIGAQLTEPSAGVGLSTAQVGDAASFYVAGAVVGALFFGYLTDRFGRRRLFMLTLGMYVLCTFATAFSFAPWYFFLFRTLTGFAIGGEYSAINSAIDELIPARVRGSIDLVINGSFWMGGILAAALSYVLLTFAPAFWGWRLAYGLGVLLGFFVLLVRRNLPESPRWLFIHGRAEEAEAIVDRIEKEVAEETGRELESVDRTITVRQRRTISFVEIARTAFRLYPTRSLLALALFIGQAFIYNAISFNLGTLLGTFFGVAASTVPLFAGIFALSNFAGPLSIGRLFDTVGRKPMIAITYLGSAGISVILALFFVNGALNAWTFIAVVMACFFLASAGASSAYLTASEIFPMETRAMAIAFFYAVGTGIGGITGPALFSNLIASKSANQVTVGFLIGAAVMAIGGVAALLWGVKAERRQLEDIAKPLTAAEAEVETEAEVDAEAARGAMRRPQPAAPEPIPAVGEIPSQVRHARALAAERRAAAAEHRAMAEELEAAVGADHGEAAVGADHGEATGSAASDRRRAEVERTLAEVATLEALAEDEIATAFEELSRTRTDGERGTARPSAELRSEAARHRAEAHRHDAAALTAEDDRSAETERALAAEELEKARAAEQRALAQGTGVAEQSDGHAHGDGDGDGDGRGRGRGDGDGDGEPSTVRGVDRARAEDDERTADEGEREIAGWRAEMHRRWAAVHDHLAASHAARARSDGAIAERLAREAEALAGRARAAGFRLESAEHRHDAASERTREEMARELGRDREERARVTREEQRIRERLQRRRAAATSGLRRYRPGPGRWPGGRAATVPPPPPEEALDTEIEAVERALDEHGPLDRRELSRLVGARYWGPGAFREALRVAVDEGGARRLTRTVYAPPEGSRTTEDPVGANGQSRGAGRSGVPTGPGPED